MKQRRLGTTGVWVSELCLGTMMFGEWAPPAGPLWWRPMRTISQRSRTSPKLGEYQAESKSESLTRPRAGCSG